MRYYSVLEAKWITIGAQAKKPGTKGANGKKHGGVSVLISDDGTILKGPAHMKGKKPDELGGRQKTLGEKPGEKQEPKKYQNLAFGPDGEIAEPDAPKSPPPGAGYADLRAAAKVDPVPAPPAPPAAKPVKTKAAKAQKPPEDYDDLRAAAKAQPAPEPAPTPEPAPAKPVKAPKVAKVAKPKPEPEPEPTPEPKPEKGETVRAKIARVKAEKEKRYNDTLKKRGKKEADKQKADDKRQAKAEKDALNPVQAEARKKKQAERIGKINASRPQSLISLVKKEGGISGGDYNYATDIKEYGLKSALNKRGLKLDDMAKALQNAGHLVVPDGKKAEDVLLDGLQRRANSALHEHTGRYDSEYDDFINNREDANNAPGADSDRTAAVISRGEEAGENQGDDDGLAQILGFEPGRSDADEPEPSDYGHPDDYEPSDYEPEEGDLGDGGEITGADTSFDFGTPEPAPATAAASPPVDMFGNATSAKKQPDMMTDMFGARIQAEAPRVAPIPTIADDAAKSLDWLDKNDPKKDGSGEMFGSLFSPRGASAKTQPAEAPGEGYADLRAAAEPETPPAKTPPTTPEVPALKPHKADKTYLQLIKKAKHLVAASDSNNGIYEIDKKHLKPEILQKLRDPESKQRSFYGDAPETDSFRLAWKHDVTGDPNDDGVMIIDKRQLSIAQAKKKAEKLASIGKTEKGEQAQKKQKEDAETEKSVLRWLQQNPGATHTELRRRTGHPSFDSSAPLENPAHAAIDRLEKSGKITRSKGDLPSFSLADEVTPEPTTQPPAPGAGYADLRAAAAQKPTPQIKEPQRGWTSERQDFHQTGIGGVNTHAGKTSDGTAEFDELKDKIGNDSGEISSVNLGELYKKHLNAAMAQGGVDKAAFDSAMGEGPTGANYSRLTALNGEAARRTRAELKEKTGPYIAHNTDGAIAAGYHANPADMVPGATDTDYRKSSAAVITGPETQAKNYKAAYGKPAKAGPALAEPLFGNRPAPAPIPATAPAPGAGYDDLRAAAKGPDRRSYSERIGSGESPEEITAELDQRTNSARAQRDRPEATQAEKTTAQAEIEHAQNVRTEKARADFAEKMNKKAADAKSLASVEKPKITIEKSIGYSGKTGDPSYLAKISGKHNGKTFNREFQNGNEDKKAKSDAFRKKKGTYNETHEISPGELYEHAQNGTKKLLAIQPAIDGGTEGHRVSFEIAELKEASKILKSFDSSETLNPNGFGANADFVKPLLAHQAKMAKKAGSYEGLTLPIVAKDLEGS
jgi:hypothetical protein